MLYAIGTPSRGLFSRSHSEKFLATRKDTIIQESDLVQSLESVFRNGLNTESRKDSADVFANEKRFKLPQSKKRRSRLQLRQRRLQQITTLPLPRLTTHIDTTTLHSKSGNIAHSKETIAGRRKVKVPANPARTAAKVFPDSFVQIQSIDKKEKEKKFQAAPEPLHSKAFACQMEVLGGASRAASVNPCTADVGIPLKEATWRFNIGKWTKSSTKVLSNNSVQIKSSNGVLNPNPYIPLLCNLCGINVVNVLWHSTTALCNSSAETVLPCGHTVAWHCGQEEDPRIAGAKPCLTCMAQQWRHYIDSVIPLHLASGGHTAVQSLRSTWLPRLEAMVGVLQVRDVAYDMEPHIQARCRIANAVLRNMTGREPHISAHPPPRWALLSEAESDLGKYRFVVCSAQAGWMETTDSDKAVVGRFQSIAPTKFGTGAKFDLFSEIALFELMRTRLLFDGAETVDVCVGMVYSYNTIKVSEPFAMRPSDPLAQQVATVYRDDHCYDAVECAADANVTCTAASESAQLLSWESGAAIPLAVVRITHSSQCMLCFENFTLVEGLPCAASSKHFTCWDCLLLSYQAAAKVDAIKSTLSAEGDLLCCLPQCRHPISLSALAAARSPESVLNAQQMLKVHTIKDREISEALARQKSLIQAEYARIEQIKNVDEKTATKLRLRIVDEVLTLRCPRCGMAFIDFDGCFAITCTYGSCRCSFCAWCLQDCGKDAHAHVLHCSESSAPGTLHSTKNVFEEHHRKRKLVKTKALVAQADLSIEATKILKQLLVDDLPDASFL